MMAEANAEPPKDRCVILRIGINLGDVIVEGGDLYGDGVIVAARLESLAEPGDILITGTVYDQVKSKLRLDFDNLGNQTLKNLIQSVCVYRVVDRARSPASSSGERRPEAFAVPSKPSIIVLPFENLSSDPEQEYLADGLTEDIITGLSRVRDLFVIARNSAFAYKGQAVAVTQVARDLGVRYVLEGSVRRSGHRVRITAQLVDAISGHHVWAEKFDRELIEIFDLQDEITRNVVASTQTQILLAEGGPTHRHNRPDMSVWSSSASRDG